MSINLIPTKLIIPKRQPGVIRRPRLIDFLHEHLERKLLFVTAPAGYGKTTLLDQWLQAEGSSISYLRLTLSEADNDAAHLLAGLSTTLKRLLPAATPLPAVDEAESSLSYSLTLLFRRAAEVTWQGMTVGTL